MTVIAAIEFQNQIAPGKCASKPRRAHRRFRAAAHKSNFLDARNRFANSFGEFHFKFGGDAETCAAMRLIRNRIRNRGIRVAQNQRAPRAHVIDVRISVGVPNFRAFAARRNNRIAAHGSKRAHGTIHAANKSRFGALKNFFGAVAIQSRSPSAIAPHLSRDR